MTVSKTNVVQLGMFYNYIETEELIIELALFQWFSIICKTGTFQWLFWLKKLFGIVYLHGKLFGSVNFHA